jgi:hypothetical protein
MEFLYWRHPEIRMQFQLAIKPGGSGFLSSDTEEIGSCFICSNVDIIIVAIMAVRPITIAAMAVIVAIAIMTAPMLTVAGFEWPIPAHWPIFSSRELKSKLGM